MMKKSVLFIISRLPYPPVGGDRLRDFNVLKVLAKHFDVHLVSIIQEEASVESKDALKKYTKSCRLFYKSKKESYVNCLKAFTNYLPLQVNYYYFKDVQAYIDQKVQECDFAFSTLIRTAHYLSKVKKPKILNLSDSIALNYKHSSARVHSLFWKAVYSIESKLLLSYERKMAYSFSQTLMLNRNEIEQLACPEKITWVPLGVKEFLFNYEKKDKESYGSAVSFLGKLDYQPNIDAVVWFSKNVLPYLHKDLKFVVVGSNPNRKILQLAKEEPRIEVTGFIEDPYLILSSSACVVAPMQTGGGIQNKILESMALGTITVTTHLGAKPIVGEKESKSLLIEDDPKKMADLINRIYQNPNEFGAIKKNAREFIKNHFTWEIYERAFLSVVDQHVLKELSENPILKD